MQPHSNRPCVDFYAAFTRTQYFSTHSIRTASYRDDLAEPDRHVMDIPVLLLLVALVGLTAGYLWLCGRLEGRK